MKQNLNLTFGIEGHINFNNFQVTKYYKDLNV